MITKELAMTLRVGTILWHNTAVNADGTPLRARVNGRCKTWKQSPWRWQLPMKYGLKQAFVLGVDNNLETAVPDRWSLPERWAVERYYTGESN